MKLLKVYAPLTKLYTIHLIIQPFTFKQSFYSIIFSIKTNNNKKKKHHS